MVKKIWKDKEISLLKEKRNESKSELKKLFKVSWKTICLAMFTNNIKRDYKAKYADESLRKIVNGFLKSRELHRYKLKDRAKIQSLKLEIIKEVEELQKKDGFSKTKFSWNAILRTAKRLNKNQLVKLGFKDEKMPLKWSNSEEIKKEKQHLDLNKDEQEVKKYAQKILRLLRMGQPTVAGLSKKFNKSKEFIMEALEDLKNAGYFIEIPEKIRGKVILSVRSKKDKDFKILPIKKNHFCFTVLASSCLGNKYQQLSLLNMAKKMQEDAGIDFSIHIGDVIAGKKTRERADELFLFTAQEQIDYAIRHYPQSKKFKTYIIAGKEDLSWGFNTTREICKKREDLVFADKWSSEFKLKNFKIEAIYPRKGIDRPYTLSYRAQQIAKSLTASLMSRIRKEGVGIIPRMVFTGKFMAQGWVPRGFGNFMVPGFLSQTPSLKAANISPDIGILFVEAEYDKEGNLVHNSLTVDFWDFSPYVVENDYGEVLEPKNLADNEALIFNLIKNQPLSVGEVSRRLNISTENIETVVENLRKMGCKIEIKEDTKKITVEPKLKEEFTPPSIELRDEFSYGSVSDIHFGSKLQQPAIVEKVYDYAEKEWKAKFVNCTGDVTDGQRMYRTQDAEMFAHGADEQVNVACETWPRKKLITFIISGNHDESFWSASFHNVVRRISEKRPDIHYLIKGNKFAKEAIFSVNKDGKIATDEESKLVIYNVHPRGGSGQFRSYKAQKHAENLVEYIIAKILKDPTNVDLFILPHVYEMGHWHVAAYVRYMGIDIFLNPAMQAQTGFEKELGLSPDIGSWMKKITLDKHGNAVKLRLKYLDMIPFVKKKDYESIDS